MDRDGGGGDADCHVSCAGRRSGRRRNKKAIIYGQKPECRSYGAQCTGHSSPAIAGQRFHRLTRSVALSFSGGASLSALIGQRKDVDRGES